MKLARPLVLSALILGTSAIAACGGSVEATPQTSASAVSKAPVGASTHGAVKVIGEALGEVSLRPDQRTALEQLATEAEARHAPTAEGRKDLMNALADQVEKGQIDRAALQPKFDRVTNDLATVRDADRAAFVRLHDVLDKEQRNDFADALQDRMKGKHGELAEGRGQLKQFAKDLNLTDDQKDQLKDLVKSNVKAAMKAHKGGWRHHGDGPLEAFREDKLDLDKVAPPKDIKQVGQDGFDRITGFVEKALPILTPAQRKIAADKIRAKAAEGDASLLVH